MNRNTIVGVIIAVTVLAVIGMYAGWFGSTPPAPEATAPATTEQPAATTEQPATQPSTGTGTTGTGTTGTGTTGAQQ